MVTTLTISNNHIYHYHENLRFSARVHRELVHHHIWIRILH